LADPAYEISVVTGCAVYDCLYVALGELLEARVVTADKRLIDSLEAGGLTARAVWIADIE
jgi:predicted nucleic acid-binding protein